MRRVRLPSSHDQTQAHPHRGLDEHQVDFYHPLGHSRMAAFSSLHNALYHMRSNQPTHLNRKAANQYISLVI